MTFRGRPANVSTNYVRTTRKADEKISTTVEERWQNFDSIARSKGGGDSVYISLLLHIRGWLRAVLPRV